MPFLHRRLPLSGWRKRVGLLAGSLVLLGALTPVACHAAEALKLRILGGLAGVNQFTRHEAPFWNTRLAQISAGRYTAEIAPFDRAGVRSQEMLSLIQLGAVPFGTVQLGPGSGRDPELIAPDLPGLNPDMASLRRSVAAFRPDLERLLRERHGIEVLAVYAYPAQVLFCNRAFRGLDDLKGRRVRVSSPTQSDWVEALGGRPVATSFADIVTNMRAGNLDCAITGTMSGHTIGLHELTTHLQPLPVTWGLSVFAANGAAWRDLPGDLRALLRRELPVLEKAIWDEAERDTHEGVACNVGRSICGNRPRGHMVAVPLGAKEEKRRREIFETAVLTRWVQRCGNACVQVWNRTLAPVSGIEAHDR